MNAKPLNLSPATLFISYVPVAGAFVAGTTGPFIFRQSPDQVGAHYFAFPPSA